MQFPPLSAHSFAASPDLSLFPVVANCPRGWHCILSELSDAFCSVWTHTYTRTGYIDGIDYATGTLTIEIDGGTGAKVRINDPTGVHGRANSATGGFDDRFCLDPENPTIRSATGFPMCVPRTDPATADDPECPKANRPKLADGSFNPSFTMVRT
jgi:hypothetical protein